MSQINSKNNLYVDQYLPLQEPSQESPLSQPSEDSYIPEEYAGFDTEYAEGSEFGMEEYAGEEAAAEAEADYDTEIPEGPTPEQEKLIDWLEDKGEKLDESFQETQGQFRDLQDGMQELPPEEKAKRLREIEDALGEIEGDLQAYAGKEKELQGKDSNDLAGDLSLDSENLAEEMEELQEGLDEEIKKTDEAVAEAEEQAVKAEAKAEENKETKGQLLEALGYLNGAKGEQYFSAKVWGKKHIKDYHKEVTGFATNIVSKMAAAAVSGDWDVDVLASIEALPTDQVDNTLALVYVVLEKQDPALFKKIPSKILEAMSDAIHRGNSPKDESIYYIKQRKNDKNNNAAKARDFFAFFTGHFGAIEGTKYDGPQDNRRRQDMKHENISLAEAAQRLAAYAESNREFEEPEVETPPIDPMEE